MRPGGDDGRNDKELIPAWRSSVMYLCTQYPYLHQVICTNGSMERDLCGRWISCIVTIPFAKEFLLGLVHKELPKR
jgi:hypothetical protein